MRWPKSHGLTAEILNLPSQYLRRDGVRSVINLVVGSLRFLQKTAGGEEPLWQTVRLGGFPKIILQIDSQFLMPVQKKFHDKYPHFPVFFRDAGGFVHKAKRTSSQVGVCLHVR
jgi:hypothetical protein